MSVPDLLAELRNRDIRIWAEGDRLRCNGPVEALTPELRGQLQQSRNDVLAFLRLAGSLAQLPRAVVPLQPRGGGIPVFAVAGHNGDVFCYRALVQRLGNNRPFYGLQPPGLDGRSEPLARIEDLGAYFVEQIRACCPDGPYIIAAYCAGGAIGFELTRQLLQQGGKVHFLALFGCPYPTAYRWLPRLREQLAEVVKRARQHAGELSSLPLGKCVSYLAERLQARRLSFVPPSRDRGGVGLSSTVLQHDSGAPVITPEEVLRLRVRVQRATIAAARRYLPRRLPIRVCLFLPSQAWADSSDKPLRWRLKAERAEEYVGPDGCLPDMMLREPYAPIFAQFFRKASEANVRVGR